VELLTGAPLAMQTTICQVPGTCLKMSAEDFKALAQRPSFRQVLNHSLLCYLAQLAQSIACNRLHSVEQRFARWLLLTSDRVGSEFFLTQEFLAEMLGVHRPSVSLVAEAFQHEGIIKYHRGHISILDRSGLERRTCECYGMLRAQLRSMQLPVPHALHGEQSDAR
jgi:CRP-like cAMP-binding protein